MSDSTSLALLGLFFGLVFEWEPFKRNPSVLM